MNNRTIAKFFFSLATLAAGYMTIEMFYASFSQTALSLQDWILTLYLVPGAVGFAFLTADSNNRNELVRIFWTSKIQWGYVYLWLCAAFIAVRATNVSQYYTLHIISTAAIFVGSGALPMYLKKWKRYLAYTLWSGSVGYFIHIFKNHPEKIAYGEMAVTLVAIGIVWIIINEQIDK